MTTNTPVRPLFMMTQRNVLSGETKIVYGHATSNVMSEFWEAYCDEDNVVEIQRIRQGANGVPSMMATARPAEAPRLVEILPGDGTSHMLEVSYVSDFPRNKLGVCVFCEGDSCAEYETAPQRIKDYYTKNASWASTCPICDGRPS